MSCAPDGIGIFHMTFSTSVTTRTQPLQCARLLLGGCRTTWIKTLDPPAARQVFKDLRTL